MWDYVQIHRLRPMILLDGQGLRRNMIGKLVTRKFREVVRGKTFLNGQKCKHIWVPCECSLKCDLN